MSRNKWKEIQEQLKAVMKKEISIMRELLANMHQEEHLILSTNPTPKETLLVEREGLQGQVDHLKTARQDLVRQLVDLLPFSKKSKPFDHLLAIDDEGYSELQLLQDQLSALTERAHFQQERNLTLAQAKRELAINPSSLYNPVVKLHPKKRTTMTVCEE